MDMIAFNPECDFMYHWCGRFIAPNSSWTHIGRKLVDYELIIVTEGTLYIADEDNEFVVNPGEYLIMPPTPFQHGFKTSYCSFYWMHWSYNNGKNNHITFSDSVHDIDSAGLIVIPVIGSARSADRLIILMKQLQDSDRRYRDANLNRYLTGAVLSELSLQCSASLPDEQARHKEQTCQDITEYISWHIGENLRCSQIAEYFGYNEKYLTTLFKRRFGISIKQYVIQEKMERAKALLSESGLPVSQIGYSLGFPDMHNFSHAFKSAVGMPPGEYRESYNTHNIFDR